MPTVTPSSCSVKPLGVLVRAASSQSIIPVTMTIDGSDLSQLGVCTRIQVQQDVIAQFQNTFDESIYITPFGDAPGDVHLEFLVNKRSRECSALIEPGGSISGQYGKRLLPGRSAAVTINIFDMVLNGFLTGLVVNGAIEGTPMLRVTLKFKAWPV